MPVFSKLNTYIVIRNKGSLKEKNIMYKVAMMIVISKCTNGSAIDHKS